jgi:hypothetical protein
VRAIRGIYSGGRQTGSDCHYLSATWPRLLGFSSGSIS